MARRALGLDGGEAAEAQQQACSKDGSDNSAAAGDGSDGDGEEGAVDDGTQRPVRASVACEPSRPGACARRGVACKDPAACCGAGDGADADADDADSADGLELAPGHYGATPVGSPWMEAGREALATRRRATREASDDSAAAAGDSGASCSLPSAAARHLDLRAAAAQRAAAAHAVADAAFAADAEEEPCGICFDGAARVRLAPCGHDACAGCCAALFTMRHAEVAACPFCRQTVAAFAPVL